MSVEKNKRCKHNHFTKIKFIMNSDGIKEFTPNMKYNNDIQLFHFSYLVYFLKGSCTLSRLHDYMLKEYV